MNANQIQFFKDLAALMQKHKVSISAGERSYGYDGYAANGLEFDFVDATDIVEIGKGTCSYNGFEILEIVTKKQQDSYAKLNKTLAESFCK